MSPALYATSNDCVSWKPLRGKGAVLGEYEHHVMGFGLAEIPTSSFWPVMWAILLNRCKAKHDDWLANMCHLVQRGGDWTVQPLTVTMDPQATVVSVVNEGVYQNNLVLGEEKSFNTDTLVGVVTNGEVAEEDLLSEVAQCMAQWDIVLALAVVVNKKLTQHQAHLVYRPAQMPADTVVQLADQFLRLIDYVNHNGLNVTLANVHQCIGEPTFTLPFYRKQPLADYNAVKHEALVESRSEPVVASSEQTRIWLDSQNNHHRFYHLAVIRPQEVVDSARVQSAFDGLTKQFPILVSRFVDQLNQVFRYEAIDSSNLVKRVTIDEALFNEPVKLRSVLHDAHRLDDADHPLFSVVELVSNGSDRIEWLSMYCHYVLGDHSKFHYWVEQLLNLIRNPSALPLTAFDANASDDGLDPTEFWKTHISDGTLYLDLDGQPSQPLNHTCHASRYEPVIPSSLMSHLPLLIELMSMSYLELLQGFMALFLLRLAQQSSVVLFGQADHNSAVPWVAQTTGEISAKDALHSLVEQYRQSTQYDWSQFSFPEDSRKPSIRVTALSMLPGYAHDFGQPYAETSLALTWLHKKDNSTLKLVVDYDKGEYQMATIERMIKNFLFFTSQCCGDITQDWRGVDVVHPDEQSVLLNEFAITKHDYDPYDAKALGVLDLFIGNVRQCPESVAVECGDHRETYRSLFEKVQALVTHFRSISIQRQERIAVVVESNAFTVMTLLALWTLGAVYVPIDSQLPQERQQYMIETAGCKRVFSTTFTKPDWIEAIAIQEVVDNMSSNKDHVVLPDGNIKHMPDEIAYIAFTSGTTGKPKGIIVHYGAFNNLIITHPLFAQECPRESRWLLTVGPAFDPYLYGTFLSLCCGWTVVLASHEIVMDVLPTINGILTTPSFIAALDPENYPMLKWVSVGGEALPQTLADKWSPTCHLYNGYGPTETTVEATTKEIKSGNKVTIGRPLPNRKCYILDNRQQLLPIGTIGEIYIGGVGVSQGYINRPELNETRFIPNPFASGRLYRTGDYGRWLPSGELECLGRADDQVKIRGFRVEIGEIRGALLKQPGVRDAFVLVVDKKLLVGFIVGEPETHFSNYELRKALQNCLPEYMVPHHLVVIQDQSGFPRTVNGKVDQQRLLTVFQDYRTQQLDVEEGILSLDTLSDPQYVLVTAVSKALELPLRQLSLTSSLLQLGGDSISAVQISVQCRQHGWNVPVSLLLQEDSLERVSQLMDRLEDKCAVLETNGLLSSTSTRQWDMSPSGLDTVYRELSALGWKPGEVQSVYPMLPMQQGMMAATARNPAEYVIQLQVTLHGTLSKNDITEIIWSLVQSYDAMRVHFMTNWSQGNIHGLQITKTPSYEAFLRDQWCQLEPGVDGDSYARNEVKRGFGDLTPTIRFAGQPIATDCHKLLITAHHAVVDGWSVGILLRSLLQKLNLKLDCTAENTMVFPSFGDYSLYVHNRNAHPVEASKTYWQEYLADIDTATIVSLPGDRDGAGSVQEAEAVLYCNIPELCDVLKTHAITMYTLIQTAWALTLNRYTGGQTDLLFGQVLSGREETSYANIDQLVGCLVNALPVRIQLTSAQSVLDLLKHVQRQHHRMLQHQYCHLTDINQWVDQPDVRVNDLFNSLLVYQNFPSLPSKNNRLQVLESTFIRSSEFALTPMVEHSGEELVVRISHRPCMVHTEYVVRIAQYMASCFHHLVASLLDHGGYTPALVPFKGMSDYIARKCFATQEMVAPTYAIDTTLCVHDVLRQEAYSIGDRMAIEYGDSIQWTYSELYQRSRYIAYGLLASGVKREEPVGLVMGRQPSAIAAMFGILMAGAAYVPMNADFPVERIRFIVQDCGIRMVLTNTSVDLVGVQILDIDTLMDQPAAESPLPQVKPTDLSHIIYTSGTTGNPKGVQQEHRTVANYVQQPEEVLGLVPGLRMMQSMSLASDCSTIEVFGGLCNGVTLVLRTDMLDTLAKVDTVMLTPSVLATIDPFRYPNITCVLVGGEALPLQTAERWARQCRLINVYGPSECFATHAMEYRAGDPVTIGRVIGNIEAYILDDQLRPVPFGVPGEIFLGGIGLTRGYVNRPELNQTKFVINPFNPDGGRLYQSGDLGRWLVDGTVEYFARKDDQVKIRGYRVEPQEVEAVIVECPGVVSAAVLPHDGKLYGFCSPESVDIRKVKEFLDQRLPPYMVPQDLFSLESIPLTVVGKIDKHSLKITLTARLAHSDERVVKGPTNATEQAIHQAMGETLDISLDHLDVRDSFFQLGGDSILAIRFSSLCREYGIQLSIAQIFRCKSVASLAELVSVVGITDSPLPPLTPWELTLLDCDTNYISTESVTLVVAEELLSEFPSTLSKVIQTISLFNSRYDSVARRLVHQPHPVAIIEQGVEAPHRLNPSEGVWLSGTYTRECNGVNVVTLMAHLVPLARVGGWSTILQGMVKKCPGLVASPNPSTVDTLSFPHVPKYEIGSMHHLTISYSGNTFRDELLHSGLHAPLSVVIMAGFLMALHELQVFDSVGIFGPGHFARYLTKRLNSEEATSHITEFQRIKQWYYDQLVHGDSPDKPETPVLYHYSDVCQPHGIPLVEQRTSFWDTMYDTQAAVIYQPSSLVLQLCHHDATVAESLLATWEAQVNRLLDIPNQLRGTEHAFIPADFPHLAVTSNDLDELMCEIHQDLGIPPAAVQDVYPLSTMQQNFVVNTLRDSTSYIVQHVLRITGALDLVKYRAVWDELGLRHTILRTKFLASRMVQVVTDRMDIDWVVSDTPLSTSNEEYQHTMRQLGFDLFGGHPLLRMHLFPHSDGHGWLCFIAIHHAVIDGWSYQLVMNESLSLYHDLHLTAKVPYRLFIESVSAGDTTEDQKYWTDYLEGFESTPNLPFPHTPRIRMCQKDAVVLSRTAPLHRLCRTWGITFNVLLRAVWALTLTQYLGQPNEVTFGVMVSGRDGRIDGLDRLVGPTTNTLPFRAKVDPRKSVVEWLQELAEQSNQLLEHEQTSLVDIKHWAGLDTDDHLFQTMITVGRYLETSAPSRDSLIEYHSLKGYNETEYPLMASFDEPVSGGALHLTIVASHEPYYLDELVNHIAHLLLQLETVDSTSILGRSLLQVSSAAVTQVEARIPEPTMARNDRDGLLEEVQQAYLALTPHVASVSYDRFSEKPQNSNPQLFWETYLQGVIPTPDLPLPKPSSNRLESVTELFNIPLSRIQDWCGKLEITINSLVRGLWTLLMARYLAKSTREVIFGVRATEYDGDDFGIEEIASLTVNTLPFRMKLDPTYSVNSWLQYIHTQSGILRNYSHVDLADIEAWVNNKPLFQSILTNVKLGSRGMPNLSGAIEEELRSANEDDRNLTVYPLMATFAENGDKDRLQLQISGKHETGYYLSMMSYLNTILEMLVDESPSANRLTLGNLLDQIPRLELERIQTWSQGTRALYDGKPRLVHDLVLQDKLPSQLNTVALVSLTPPLEFTYYELITRAQQVAQSLMAVNASSRFVILFFERSSAFVMSMLGTLIAGRTCVPMDASHTSERLVGMKQSLGEAHPVVLTSQEYYDTAEKLFDGTIICVDDLAQPLVDNLIPSGCNPPPMTPTDVAFVYFTSGSTGKPKAVPERHESVVNYILGGCDILNLPPRCRFLQAMNIGFDSCLLELLTTFHTGGTVVLQSDNLVDSLGKVDACMLTPSMLQAVGNPSEYPDLRIVVTVGEPLPFSLAEKWSVTQGGQVRLFNTYGPTETVVTSHFEHVTFTHDDSLVTIGRTIPNVQCYILDDKLDMVPIGVIGEICIGGMGVCHGYLNDEQRSRDAFLPNPFGSGMLYRTGDLGCWLPDGRVYCMGRKDNQVKLRGFRIELGEVESAVYKASPHVQQVVALVKQGKLVVYVTSVDQQVVPITELRKCLSQALPSFMVPDYVISIAEIPHNSNGKVDRKQLSTLALPYVDDSADVVQYDFSPMEKELFTGLQGLIKDILRLTESHPPIRPGSSFFKLGGDSITAIQLWGRSKRELGLNFHVRDIFDHQGILGALVKHACQSSGGSVLPVNTSVNVTRYPCTPLQLGMISALIKDRTAYILQASFTVGPSLDILRFQRAWSVVVENNPTLRTRFDYDKANDQWMQVIVEHIELEWQTFTDKETYLAQDHKRGFTVDGPLIRCGYHPNKHQWVLTIHHSITDGWTSGLIFEQVIDTYHKLAEGQLVPRNVDNGYAQFAHYVNNQSTDAAREFWQHELEGVVEGTLLSDGSTNTTTPEKAEDSVRYVVDDIAELNQYIEHHGVTLSSLLRVVWALVLRRYTGREKDVVFGVVVSGRNVPVPNVDRITGLCINTIPCRIILEKHQTVETLITSVHQGSIRTHGYDCYPLGDVHKWSGFPANQEMFNILLVVENLPYQSDGGLDLHMESVLNPTEYPLSALVYPSQDQLEISMNYHTSKFTAMFVQQMLDDFVHTLRSLLIDNSKALVDLSVHFPALHSFVHNPADYPARHAHYYVEQQIQNNPDNQALYDLSTDQGFTYGQLDTMSHYVAYMLLKAVESKSMKADQIVGIVARNTPGLVVAQLAVWKLGLSFVVIDPEYPMDRIQFIMSDTQCIACIGYGRKPPCSVQGDASWITLEGITECLLSIDPLPHLPKITVDPHDLAYVIYTSGSTGQPKGVLVEHGSAAHYFYSYQTSVANITSQTTLPTLVAPTFDAAIGELWTTLSFGGTVLLTHKREDFSRAFCMATKIFATPSLLSYFDPHEFSHLQQVVLGGEPAELELIRKWQLCGIPQVVNEYGPSEVPIGSHCKVYDQSSIATVVSVGQPLPGYKGVILDSWMIPVPVGVIGEIWLGGETVARGYLHREELTRERFVDTPTWGRLYRTGDLARWLPNGDVEILGRADNQVKVRGFRVELEEVERVILASVPDISRVCIAYDYEMKILLGFVTPEDVNVDQVLNALQDRVPHYMVPNSIVPLPHFPLSHNGKTDRKALLALPRQNNVEQNAHIFTLMETKLVAVLADVLKVNPTVVSPPKDTFFTLGGNSISAMHFVARCKNNGIHVDLVDINRRTTIAALAKHAREGSDELVADIQSTEFTHGPFLLTPIQRAYFGSDLANPHQWPLPLLIKVALPRNLHIWRDIVTSLVSHHDMLRARFEQVDGEWHGRVLPIEHDPVKVNELTLTNEKSYIEVLAEINRAMNFTTGPIYLAYVLNYQGTQYFYLALHHLISDNMSMNLLVGNIRTLLNGQPLPEKTLPYALWSQNLDALRQGISLDAYELPSEDELVLPPVDVDQIPHSGPICPQVLSSDLDLTTTLALEQFGHLDISIEDIMLTGLLLAYTDVFNCSSIPLQYTSHGRNALGNPWDVSHTVGFFVNLCPMVLRRKENDDLASTLNAVQSVLRGVSDFAVKYMLSGQTMMSPIAYNFLGTRDVSDSAGANGVEVIDVITSDEYQQHRVNMDPMPLIFLAKYTGECLTLLIMYEPIFCNAKNMHAVLQKWEEGVRRIVHHLKSQE